MRMPRFHVLLLIAVALALFSAIWLPGDVDRKPLLHADGSPVLKADGSAATQPDTAGYIQRHWFGFTIATLSLLFFASAAFRLLCSGLLRCRDETRAAQPD